MNPHEVFTVVSPFNINKKFENLLTYDFSTRYTDIPHKELEQEFEMSYVASFGSCTFDEFFTAINEGVFHATYEFAFVILILSGLLVATRFLDFPASLILLMSLLLYRIFQKVKIMQDHLQRLSKNLPALEEQKFLPEY